MRPLVMCAGIECLSSLDRYTDPLCMVKHRQGKARQSWKVRRADALGRTGYASHVLDMQLSPTYIARSLLNPPRGGHEGRCGKKPCHDKKKHARPIGSFVLPTSLRVLGSETQPSNAGA